MHVLASIYASIFANFHFHFHSLLKFLDEIQCSNKIQLQATAVYNPLFLFLSYENTLLCLALLLGSM